jgi:hypothetical protein
MHMRQSPLDFFTKTVLESQIGHFTSRMKFALSNLVTSSCTALCLSDPIFFFFYRAFRIICNLCSDISRGIPDISEGDQVNISLCNRKKFTNFSRVAPCMALPIVTVLPSSISTCSISSAGSTVERDSGSSGSLYSRGGYVSTC